LPLAPGSRLGPYEIVAPLGAGGMGEVYKARDPRLDRTVAIKVLPAGSNEDPDRRQRFDREARAVAALSHPNICAVYDVGHDAGVAYLVMEFLDGETLAARMARTLGPGGASQGLPPGETLAIASQLAGALAAAHKAGIVHRDLKPANVMLTKSGVKVLDFGLARMATGAAAPGLASGTMTAAAPLTGIGTLLGTLPYMSPEQVEGQEADARSDIFSLGSVIYELATGRRAFEGGSQASLIAAILERQPPPITQLQPLTPPGLERVVRACLAKAPEDRWQHAGDIARQLAWLSTESESGTVGPVSGAIPAAAKPAARNGQTLAILGMSLAAGVLIVGFVFRGLAFGPGPVSAPKAIAAPVQFTLSVPGVSLTRARVSPDGQTLALGGRRADGTTGVWIRRLDDARAVPVPNLENGAALVDWSIDGTELAINTARGLIGVRREGWLVRPLASSISGWTDAWRGDGVLLEGSETGLHRITVGSGENQVIIPGLALHPRFLSDGKRFLYTAPADSTGKGNPGAIFLASLPDAKDRRLVLPAQSSAIVAASRLLFVQDGTLFAQPFDSSAGKVSGQAAPIVDGVDYFYPSGQAQFDAAGGTIVYETPSPDDTPVWFDRKGTQTGVLDSPGIYDDALISPDGKRAVVYLRDRRLGTGDLWLDDLARGTRTRLTNDEWSETRVQWSPDGKSIAYGWDRNGPPDIYVLDVDGGAAPRLVFATPTIDFPIAWLPGNRLLVQTAKHYTVVRLDGTVDETLTGLPTSLRRELTVSPDGRWMAWSSGETGRSEVYVEPLGRTGSRVQVSVLGGRTPVWSRDGKSLYFVAQHTLFEAAVHAGASLTSDPPTPVFTTTAEIGTYDVTPDGRRFLVLRDPPPDFLRFNVIVNWQAKAK
jgi:eukaryotic-like serine/threonine-protein kinase